MAASVRTVLLFPTCSPPPKLTHIYGAVWREAVCTDKCKHRLNTEFSCSYVHRKKYQAAAI